MQNMHCTLLTERLALLPAHPDLAPQVIDFYARNDAHLAPWSPPWPEDSQTLAFQRARLAKGQAEAAAGTGLRWWLCLRGQPEVLLGNITLSAIARGPFQNALMGYGLDGQAQGQGLMREALKAVLAHAFSPAVMLHRVQANVRPENVRSLRLLEQAGFEREGFARGYLFIDGAWRDHIMLATRNPGFSGTLT